VRKRPIASTAIQSMKVCYLTSFPSTPIAAASAPRRRDGERDGGACRDAVHRFSHLATRPHKNITPTMTKGTDQFGSATANAPLGTDGLPVVRRWSAIVAR
jgi:hypothetical protein